MLLEEDHLRVAPHNGRRAIGGSVVDQNDLGASLDFDLGQQRLDANRQVPFAVEERHDDRYSRRFGAVHDPSATQS